MMQQTLLDYKQSQSLVNPDKLIVNSWVFCCQEPLTSHPKTRGFLFLSEYKSEYFELIGFNYPVVSSLMWAQAVHS